MSQTANKPVKNTKKGRTDLDDRIIELFKAERLRVKEKFPLFYALVATIGALSVFSGLNKLIEKVEFLSDNPIVLVIFGLVILIITGAAYKKLG